MQALRTAATGMAAQDLNVQVISNNIANMNTVGFKRQSAVFEDLLYQTQEQPGVQSSDQGTVVPTGVQIGAGVRAGSVYRITGQGTLTNTGNALDMAINGPGYFQVQLPDGTSAYTRAGNFSVNAQGQVVTADGYLIQPTITIPQNSTNLTISQTGQVQVMAPGATTPTVVGQIQISTFLNDAGLDAQGNNLAVESAASGPAVPSNPGQPGYGVVMQGYTEASNVDPVSEITNLIVAQRAYEMNSKVVTTADQMLQTATNTKS
jgi:flagellar basal-body rod protein FlgG